MTEHDAPSTVELTRGAPRELRGQTLSRKEKEEGGSPRGVSAARLSAALRRLAAPSAFAATRAVAAHSAGRPGSPHRGHGAAREGDARRNDRRARRERASRDAREPGVGDVERRRRRLSFTDSLRPSPRRTRTTRRRSLRSPRRTPTTANENENVTLGYETSRRTPKAPPFPSPAIETRARVSQVGETTRGERARGARVAAGRRARAVPRVRVLPHAKTGRGDSARR